MHKTTSAEIFIRLLSEACEADRNLNNAKLSATSKAQAAKFKQVQLTAMFRRDDLIEPLDCVQQAAALAHDRRFERSMRDSRL